MGKTTYYQNVKRPEKLSGEQTLDLTFDLINAFSLIKNPSEAADFINNLFTADEIKDLAKRLRIAKLLIKRDSQRDIAKSVHCSLATVSKVSLWLQTGKTSLIKTIGKLPKKFDVPKNLPKGPIEFHAPEILFSTAKYIMAKSQTKKVEKFMDQVEAKKLGDKIFAESIKPEFQRTKSIKPVK